MNWPGKPKPKPQEPPQPHARCVPEVITFEWFFNQRPPTKRRTRRGDRW